MDGLKSGEITCPRICYKIVFLDKHPLIRNRKAYSRNNFIPTTSGPLLYQQSGLVINMACYQCSENGLRGGEKEHNALTK